MKKKGRATELNLTWKITEKTNLTFIHWTKPVKWYRTTYLRKTQDTANKKKPETTLILKLQRILFFTPSAVVVD